MSTILKVLEYVEREKNPSFSDIGTGLNLSVKTVFDCIEILKSTGYLKIEIPVNMCHGDCSCCSHCDNFPVLSRIELTPRGTSMAKKVRDLL